MDKLTEKYSRWAESFAAENPAIDLEKVKEALKSIVIETPSWGYADSGTRFAVFAQPAAAKTLRQKLEDAAQVHKYTGVAGSVALHIPWDKTDDWSEVKGWAQELGLKIGAINPNLFQEQEYKLGSLTNPDPAVRAKARAHCLECIEIMRQTGSEYLSLWLADGTNYPGQDDFRARKHRLEEELAAIYQAMDEHMKMLIEYKFFEPAFYHTDIADWGMATTFARKLGDRALTLVDTGHHPLGTNIEHIVAFLIDEGKLGGFHFNDKKYADDDVTVGSIDPYQLFLIFCELVGSDGKAIDVAYMIDQSHNLKPKIEAMIQSVLNIQTAYAKALLVDRQKLAEAQNAGDIVSAEGVLKAAFETDVRPLLAKVRQELDRPEDPLAVFRASGYLEKAAKERS